MIRPAFFRPAARIAIRDLRGSLARSGLIAATLAIAVASIAGVHSAANAARDALDGDSRAWLAGDIGVDTIEPVNQHQVDVSSFVVFGDGFQIVDHESIA